MNVDPKIFLPLTYSGFEQKVRCAQFVSHLAHDPSKKNDLVRVELSKGVMTITQLERLSLIAEQVAYFKNRAMINEAPACVPEAVEKRQGWLHIAAVGNNIFLQMALHETPTLVDGSAVLVDLQDDEGNTPLHIATDLTFMNYLLSMGADGNIRNNIGETALLGNIRLCSASTIMHEFTNPDDATAFMRRGPLRHKIWIPTGVGSGLLMKPDEDN